MTVVAPRLDDRDQKISDQLIRLVQVFFAFVLAQSLLLHKEVVLNPFAQENSVSALAIAGVLYTTLTSWVDWHVTMAYNPYSTRSRSERWRVYSDVGVAGLYGYLLFSVGPLVGRPHADAAPHLLGYFLVFSLYLASGLLRRKQHGKAASRPKPLIVCAIAFLLLMFAYRYLWLQVRNDTERVWLNVAAVLTALVVMFCFRQHRAYRRTCAERKSGNPVVGIDVDGVLADQTREVLPIVNRKFGLALRYADITEWKFPTGTSDIATEIVQAQSSPFYVARMSPLSGASAVTARLWRTHRLVAVTARDKRTRPWTRLWFIWNQIRCDEIAWGLEAKKSRHNTDILIDDYIGNIEEFLRNSNGVAVLVSHPWNQDRAALEAWVTEGRCFVVSDLWHLERDWAAIVERWRKLTSAQLPSQTLGK